MKFSKRWVLSTIALGLAISCHRAEAPTSTRLDPVQGQGAGAAKTGEGFAAPAFGPDITSDVQCQSHDDCWVEEGRPVARPQGLQGKKFQPCVDGEVRPVCHRGTCGGFVYGC